MTKPAGTPGLIETRKRFGVRPGLQRIERLLAAMGNPERAYPVVHVAGTNGKGSTSVMIASILAASGMKVGLYTSPHLISYGERIVVDGAPIEEGELAALTAELAPHIEADAELTEFEIGTAIAFRHFQRRAVDVAVIEVGLGGRWDATNVVTPALTVITPVDIDHIDTLGGTRTEIAAEKAGILKPGIPLVCAPQHSDVEAVIRARADELGVSLTLADPGALSVEEPVQLALLGSHQKVNAAVAVAAAMRLAEAGWPVTRRTIVEGLGGARWPGRIEIVQRDPLVLLDGAHNLAGLEALVAALTELNWRPPGVLVFGTLAGKPAGDMLRMLEPFCRDVVFTSVTGRLPGKDPAELAAEVQSWWPGRIGVEPDPREAFRRAEHFAGSHGKILVAGSLYLVGALRDQWPWPALFRAHRGQEPAGRICRKA